MDWYVIQAYSGYEQKVKAALEERISLNNLTEKFGELTNNCMSSLYRF